MPDEMDDELKRNGVMISKEIPEANDLLSYYNVHVELCNKYSKEIEYVHGLLKELREERQNFYENKIAEISRKLKEEKISQKAIDSWLEQLKEDMNRSFAVSENFLNSFIVAKTSEFEAELKKKLGKV